MLLNGRISNRSFRRFSFPFVRPLVRRVLACFSLYCMQSEQDAERLIELGADPALVKVTGSAKYDIAGSSFKIDENFIARLQALGFGAPTPTIVGGSTWPGEELALLEIFIHLRRRFPRLKLVLVPRHVERRKQVMAEIAQSGLDFRLWSQCRESGAIETEKNETKVLLVDTTGELRAFYSVADVVFIGKSLTAKGGQNPIEAAGCSKPIVAGPHMENFSAVIGDFLGTKAIIQVADKGALEKVIADLLADEAGRESMGARARRVVLEKSGAIRKSVKLFLEP